MTSFSGKIDIIGINPYIEVPEKVLITLFKAFGKEKGPIPVLGKLNGKPFIQNVVKYKGVWRLYLNNIMREGTGLVVGDVGKVQIAYDPKPRIVPPNESLLKKLNKNKKAKVAFEKL